MGSPFRLAAPSAASVRVPGKLYTGSTRLRGFLRTALLFFFLLSAFAIAGRSGRSASLPVRAIRWFLGLDEADEFAIPLVRAEGSRIRERASLSREVGGSTDLPPRLCVCARRTADVLYARRSEEG